jgi:hypothetical protein
MSKDEKVWMSKDEKLAKAVGICRLFYHLILVKCKDAVKRRLVVPCPLFLQAFPRAVT